MASQWCAHTGFIRPTWSQTWPFGGGLNADKMVPSWRLHMCQAPQWDSNGSCPSSSCTKASQLSPSPCVSGLPKLLPLHLRPSECLQAFESVCGLCKRVSGLPAISHFTGMGRWSLADFHCQIWELFLEQDPWAWEPGVRLGPLTLQGGPLSPKCLPQCSPTTCGFGVNSLYISAPPVSLDTGYPLYP